MAVPPRKAPKPNATAKATATTKKLAFKKASTKDSAVGARLAPMRAGVSATRAPVRVAPMKAIATKPRLAPMRDSPMKMRAMKAPKAPMRAAIMKVSPKRKPKDPVVDRRMCDSHADLAERGIVARDMDIRLALIEPSANIDVFYILQGLEDPALADTSRRWFSYLCWGRTGTRGESRVQGPMGKDEVKAILAKIFKTKTGSEWGTLLPGATAAPGKYWVQAQSALDVKARWEYWVEDGVAGKRAGWHPYTAEASTEVEDLYAQRMANTQDSRTTNRLIASGSFTYKFDFDRMTQTNSVTGTVRTARRLLGGVTSARPSTADVSKKRTTTRPMKTLRRALGAKKVRKVMGAMKKRSTGIVAKGRRARVAVFHGRKVRTVWGLKKDDLVKNRNGKIVPKERSEKGKNNAWATATGKARAELGIVGFHAVGGKTEMGQILLNRIRFLVGKTEAVERVPPATSVP